MAKVILLGLEFHGRHGVFEEEAVFGARFLVDVELVWNWRGLRDRIDDTVNYAHVYETVQHEVTEQRYKLIEMLASRIAARLLAEHPRLENVLVRVHKPHAPIAGIFRDVYAEIELKRGGPDGTGA